MHISTISILYIYIFIYVCICVTIINKYIIYINILNYKLFVNKQNILTNWENINHHIIDLLM